jgi:hypothetical protein
MTAPCPNGCASGLETVTTAYTRAVQRRSLQRLGRLSKGLESSAQGQNRTAHTRIFRPQGFCKFAA